MAPQHRGMAYKDSDELTIAEAGKILGNLRRNLHYTVRHMARLNKTKMGPPYIKRGKLLYRYDYIIAFHEGRTNLRGEIPDWIPLELKSKTGEDQYPMDHPLAAITKWKEKELWRRAEPIIFGSGFKPENREKFREEHELWFGESSDLDAQTKVCSGCLVDLGWPPVEFPPKDDVANDYFQRRMALKFLIHQTYPEVVSTEATWRQMDWATMPTSAPPGK